MVKPAITSLASVAAQLVVGMAYAAAAVPVKHSHALASLDTLVLPARRISMVAIHHHAEMAEVVITHWARTFARARRVTKEQYVMQVRMNMIMLVYY